MLYKILYNNNKYSIYKVYHSTIEAYDWGIF